MKPVSDVNRSEKGEKRNISKILKYDLFRYHAPAQELLNKTSGSYMLLIIVRIIFPGIFLNFFHLSDLFSYSESCTSCPVVYCDLFIVRCCSFLVYNPERSLYVSIKIFFLFSLKIACLHKIFYHSVFERMVAYDNESSACI